MLPNLRRTLAPLALAAAALFVLMPNIAAAHNDDGYYADTANLPDQSKWMARVPDSTKVVQMSIPGTHDSGSRFGLGWSGPSLPLGLASHAVELLTVTQTLTISQQLNGGIRFLDIRLRHSNNELAVHHGPIYQNAMFGDVLKEVTSFLAANPSETVLMRVKQEHTEENTTRSFQQTFRSYFDSNKRWFAKPPAEGGNHDPTLGSVRGKILLLVDFPAHPIDSLGLHYHSTFNWQQDAYALHQPSDLHWKWEQVKGHLFSSERHGGRAINYLSGSMGGWMPIFPYFVASGHSSIGTGAPRLPTGLTTPGWEHNFPEFPRVDCFIGICTIAYEGTNTLTKDYINRVKPLYTGIVVADFPGAGFIKSVIDTNFRAQPLLNESNGLCLDIENGVNPPTDS